MKKKHKKQKLKQCTLYVDGMHCPACEVLIEKKLLKKQGIEAVDASLGKSRVSVTYMGDNKPDAKDITNELKKASDQSFEPVWHLPIMDEHKETIKGAYGDISNTGKSRYGGASSAAAFLQNFVEKDTKWAHIDIAGPAMAKAPKPPVCADQTGFGASLLMNFLKNKM